jgi:DNA-binding CsgD family transcriptional regulator
LDNLFINNRLIIPGGEDGILKKQIGWTKEIVLKYNQSNIEISYSALNFISATRNRYAYKLEGFDADWIDAGTRKMAYYTNIPSGKYIFRVKGSNNDGVWNDEGAAIAITVQPPFWATWWAYSFYTIVLLCIFAWIILYFRKKERRKNDIRFKKELDVKEKFHRKETEKIEQEIVQLKNDRLELEIKHKSQELANITMNLVRKNEMLLEMRDELDKLIPNLKQTDETNKLQRQIVILNNKINDNIKNDDNLKKFEEHFDVVHDKFIKRLTEKHPEFSATERKMCVFIKMGLSSKEIAPLMNLTVRGAETIRYKLRKKFELSRKDSLTAFLNSF